jgi:nucleotide-binding universal stress UspA family protein
VSQTATTPTVVVATDGSDVALEAAERAAPLLPADARIIVLSVAAPADLAVDASGFAGPVVSPEEAEEVAQAEAAIAGEDVERTVAVLGRDAEPKVVRGEPGTAICDVAAEVAADLVVIGAHGKGVIRRVLLGSTSEYVVRHAPCPVLVIRRRDESEPVGD